MEEIIEVHPLTADPTKAWAEISKTQKVIKIAYKPPKSEKKSNQIRIVCMSGKDAFAQRSWSDQPLSGWSLANLRRLGGEGSIQQRIFTSRVSIKQRENLKV